MADPNASTFIAKAQSFFQNYGTGYGSAVADLSVFYLGSIFGSVGNLLITGQSSLIGTLMQYFNLGILTFAGGVISVSTAMSVVNTAGTGQLLAGKSRSGPLVFRTFGAISLLTPMPSLGGYSLVQAIVLWGVLQGISIANGVWNVVVNQLTAQGGGLVVTADMMRDGSGVTPSAEAAAWSDMQLIGSAAALNGSIDLALQLYQAQLCFYSNKALLKAGNKGTSDATMAVATSYEDQGLPMSLVTYTYPESETKIIGSSSIQDCTMFQMSTPASAIDAFRRDTSLSMSDWWLNFDQSIDTESAEFGSAVDAFNAARFLNFQVLYTQMDGLSQSTYDSASSLSEYSTPDFFSLITCAADEKNCAAANKIVEAAEVFAAAQKEALLVFLTNIEQQMGATNTATAIANRFSSGGWLTSGVNYNALSNQYFVGTTDSTDVASAVRGYTMSDNIGFAVGAVKSTFSQPIMSSLSSALGLLNVDTTLCPSCSDTYLTLAKAASNLSANIDYSIPDETTSDENSMGVDEKAWDFVKQGLMKSAAFFSTQNEDSGITAASRSTLWPTLNSLETTGLAPASDAEEETSTNQVSLVGGMPWDTPGEVSAATTSSDRTTLMATSWMNAWYADGEQAVQDQKTRSWSVLSAMGCSGIFNQGLFGYNSIMGMDLNGITNACPTDGVIKGSPGSFALASIDNWSFYETNLDAVINSGMSSWVYNDIQVFLYQASKAWISNIVGDQCSSSGCQWSATFGHIKVNPLTQLQNFGFDLTSAAVNFLSTIIRDVYLTNLTIMYYYMGIQISMQFAATIISGIGQFVLGITQYVEPTIPIFGIPIGMILRAVSTPFIITGAIIKGLSTTQMLGYYLAKAKILLYVPISVAAAIPMIILGMLALCYAPIMPFLVFTFTAIGWFISVIEAVVAAPLIAMGMTSPTGHDYLGRAEQALMLFLSVIVRPVLILMGFLFAVLLTYVAVWFVSQLFVAVFASLMNTGAFAAINDWAYYAAFVMILFMYCYTIIGVIEMTMSLIYRVPNYALRWLGVPVRDYGESQRLQELKNAFVQQVQGVAQSSQSMYGTASRNQG